MTSATTAAQLHDVITTIDSLMHAVFGMIVVMMQAGFAFLEAGSVRYKNHVCLIFKNFVEIGFGVMAFWAFGYGFQSPDDNNANSFCGSGPFFMRNFHLYNNSANPAVNQKSFFNWFFAMSFAITATTIVSGAVAERV